MIRYAIKRYSENHYLSRSRDSWLNELGPQTMYDAREVLLRIREYTAPLDDGIRIVQVIETTSPQYREAEGQ